MVKHCDDYIRDIFAPKLLRWFLFIERLPASERILCREFGVNPVLYADHDGRRVRVVTASRLGDVGITVNFGDDSYQKRVPVETLTNFGDAP